jgi:hypothetical protein
LTSRPLEGDPLAIAHAEDAPPAIVRGHHGRAFRDFYFGVKLHKDGTFDH